MRRRRDVECAALAEEKRKQTELRMEKAKSKEEIEKYRNAFTAAQDRAKEMEDAIQTRKQSRCSGIQNLVRECTLRPL